MDRHRLPPPLPPPSTPPNPPLSSSSTNAPHPPPKPNPQPDKKTAARECVDILEEIGALLNVDLDRQSLSMCVSLIENGVSPGGLATVIKELRKQR